jgi:CheY-like chemotaxis protein
LSELPVILVAEDDQAIQGIVEDALSEGGFEVAVAASGEEAATLLSGNKGQYQALKRFPADLNRRDSQRVKDERVFVH